MTGGLQLFSLFVIVGSLLFGQSAWPSVPMPPPTTLDAYLRNADALIFTGRFERVVYISQSLSEKLFKASSEINPSELMLFSKEGEARLGKRFFEISSATLIAASPKVVASELKGNCSHRIIYIPTNLNFMGGSERDLQQGSLKGQEVILFLTPRTQYGVNQIDFPAPMFLQTPSENITDADLRPVSQMGDIIEIASKEKYITQLGGVCKK